MPDTDIRQIDESQIKAQDLRRILPDDVLPGLAKNLLQDIMQASPPFFMGGGNSLYNHGNVDIWGGGDNFFSLEVDVPTDIGKEVVREVIDNHMARETEARIEELGLDKEEIENQIGLFILSNVNGEADLHNFACDLFHEMGTSSFYVNKGKVNPDEVANYMDEIIGKAIKKAKDIKTKFYFQGVQKHIDAFVKQSTIESLKSAMDIFNDAMEKPDGGEWLLNFDRELDLSFDDEVIDTVLNYIVNPVKYLQDNPDMVINLTAYEQQYGPLPRQPDLPGLEQT